MSKQFEDASPSHGSFPFGGVPSQSQQASLELPDLTTSTQPEPHLVGWDDYAPVLPEVVAPLPLVPYPNWDEFVFNDSLSRPRAPIQPEVVAPPRDEAVPVLAASESLPLSKPKLIRQQAVITRTGKPVDQSEQSDLYGTNPCPSLGTLHRCFKHSTQYIDKQQWHYWDATDNQFSNGWVQSMIKRSGDKLFWIRPPTGSDVDFPSYSVCLTNSLTFGKDHKLYTAEVADSGDYTSTNRKTSYVVLRGLSEVSE